MHNQINLFMKVIYEHLMKLNRCVKSFWENFYRETFRSCKYYDALFYFNLQKPLTISKRFSIHLSLHIRIPFRETHREFMRNLFHDFHPKLPWCGISTLNFRGISRNCSLCAISKEKLHMTLIVLNKFIGTYWKKMVKRIKARKWKKEMKERERDGKRERSFVYISQDHYLPN